MTSINCWADECKWENNGWCNRGAITIGEEHDCECFKSYLDEYKESFYKVYSKDDEIYRKLSYGKKIEYNGYYFFTEDKITDSGHYFLTEARTGVAVCEFCELEKKWEKFLERVNQYPDAKSYPIKKGEGE